MNASVLLLTQVDFDVGIDGMHLGNIIVLLKPYSCNIKRN
jgi:hypothetical protein